ncbi:MAG: TRAP transporter fused permease subunit [Deltaproteobacteria bacterium]|nr:TRAP transporter fused permease subunit [Deltaproteobacteria bacterium]
MDLEDQTASEKKERPEEKGHRKIFSLFIRAILIGFTSFQLYTAGYERLPDMIQRSVHVCFGLVLTFLLVPTFRGRGPKGRPSVVSIIFTAVSLLGCAYIVIEYPRLIEGIGIAGTTFELILGGVVTLLILETGRRNTGPFLPLLALATIAYGLWGQYLPGKWAHPGFNYAFIIEYLYLGPEGIWGIVTGISATLVAAFVIFGAVILSTGAGDSFMQYSMVFAGRSYGGAAKVATVSSAMFGMISGSAIANVATTGHFTIPMMKKLGYRPAFAGAVEAVASSGGQITPPIMGAGAFIMAELINLPYLRIALAAALPAFLFYLSIWAAIDFESRKQKIKPLPKEMIPPWRKVLTWKTTGPLAVTLGVLLYFLFRGYTPCKAAFYSLAINVLFFIFLNDLRWNAIKNRLRIMLHSLEGAGRSMLTVASLIACAQVVISMVALTGLGVKLSEFIIGASAGSLFLALFLAGGVALILGMGIPTTAAYLLAASVVGPALSMLGLDPLPAHMFIFYYAIISALTPPVCTAAFTAAGIAEASWLSIAMIAIRLAIMIYVVPFFFIYRPSILFIGSTAHIIETVVVCSLCAVLFSAGTVGYFRRPLNNFFRGLLIVVGVILIIPGIWTDLLGVLTVAGVYIWHKVAAQPKASTPG